MVNTLLDNDRLIAHILTGSRFLLNYPFADHLFSTLVGVIEHVQQRGPVALLTDGDVVFQPRKVDSSGLSDAMAGDAAHCGRCLLCALTALGAGLLGSRGLPALWRRAIFRGGF